MTIKAVVFDIGNVLIEWNPERFYDSVIGEERRRAMFSETDLHGMNERVDKGEAFRDTVMAHAADLPEWRAEIEMWHDRWIEMASPAIDHSVRLLRALRRRGVPVYALSNFGVETFALAETHYPFLEEFDKRFVSGHLEMVKPYPEIYETLERETGLAPETLLFTDDRADNIEAAQARGWGVHLFEGAEAFAARLVQEGLLTEEEAR
ncbi:HAD family hydrolase [Pseudoroseicyclus aestuarii]|uniref:2-haloacid dehalogenase n=1 Tax=Pseudoroseicyclus aestuarii TaxID=1795041 RepID=A0A318T7B2_9RHOB|nr:HAD family phosphatase [Pseudoroseicyclus aestuarii]PYE84288.1 2-haloacid dehalogenase [Pseudoroseicyclus aestuarii]